jgi:DNA-binding transcriptional ArsR family regulator
MPRTKKIQICCPPKPELQERPLIDLDRAGEIEALFKVLANGTRLRLLHALARADELCVSELAEAVEMKPQAVSNQLQRLVDRGILGSRRNGSNVHYRITDPCVTNLLDQGLCLLEDAKERTT